VPARKGASLNGTADAREARRGIELGSSIAAEATKSTESTQLPFHPLADIFPLLEGAEFEELVEDVRAHGVREPIWIYEDKILDGRNRYRAAAVAGVECPARVYEGNDPVAFVISANMRRRHLTAKQKCELIGKLLKATPEKSDRQIAETARASPTTVGAVRAKMEATGDVSRLDTRRDTQGRKQPATKPPTFRRRTDTKSQAALAASAAMAKSVAEKAEAEIEQRAVQTKAAQDIGENSNGETERLPARVEELENYKRQLELENVGLRSEIQDMSSSIRERYVTLMRKLSKAARIAELKRILADIDVTAAELSAEPGPHPLDIPPSLRRASL
jgi:hypothetical protein